MNKIIEKYDSNINNLSNKVYNIYDRNLRMNILSLDECISLALKEYKPNYIAEYIYELCVSMNAFYQNNHIANLEDNLKLNKRYKYTENLKVGDLVEGPNGPRHVKDLHRGEDAMYAFVKEKTAEYITSSLNSYFEEYEYPERKMTVKVENLDGWMITEISAE